MTVSIIIPFRDKGDPWRQHNLIEVLAHLQYLDLAPTYVVDDGRTGNQPFNRSAAYNNGIQQHPADVYVFHEADMILPATQLNDAIITATTPGLVVPFTEYHYLSCTATENVHHGANPYECTSSYVMADGRSNGAINVVSAETMAAVGQWDETFEGWGHDDRAMVAAFRIATGEPTRYIDGPAIHLWHVPGFAAETRFRGGTNIAPHEQAATDANEQRYREYRKATTPDRIRELTAGKP